MNALELHPLDIWTVRDGRPFDVGGVVHARGLWPPSPWTVLGAVRTALCEASGIAAVEYGHANTADSAVKRAIEVLGRPDGPPAFRIGPVLLARGAETYWPVPEDLVTFTDKERDGIIRAARLRLRSREQLASFGCASSRLERALVPLPPHPPDGFDHVDKSVALRYLNGGQVNAWLNGTAIPPAAKKDHRLPLEVEPRIGIEIDDASGTVAEGRFYIRYAHALEKDCVLRVPVCDGGPGAVPWSALNGQHVRLGADGHLAALHWRADAPAWPATKPADSGRAALLFLSPVHPDNLQGITVNGTSVTVEAVCAGRPISIGGWQLRHDGKRQVGPRPMRRYYPAGTVAYVKATADVSALHGTSIAGDPEEKAAGFGFCLVGAAPAVEE